MRFGRVLVLLALAALLPAGSASGGGGAPKCPAAATAAGDVGSFVRVSTCSAYFASKDRYRPARYRLVSGSLPPGLSLWGDGEPAAQVDGVPRRVGVYRFTVEATDAAGGRATGTYAVEIHPRLELPLRSLGSATVGRPYWGRIFARGGKPPYSYGAFELGGLALDSATGVLAGTLTGGPFANCGPYRLTVRDATGATASALFPLELLDAVGRRHEASCDPIEHIESLAWVQGFTPRRGPVPNLAAKTAFVEIAPVTITGRGLSSVTRVAFAGTRAVFRVDSDRRITAIPPRGARTGSITLTTADGRIRDAGIYRVFFGG
jgi:hypothetical protein